VDLFVRLDDAVLTKESLKIAEDQLKRKGIYRVIDMGSSPKLLEILKDGELDYNLFFDTAYKDFLLKNGFKFGSKPFENVRILGLKVYLDGSMGANTAALFTNNAKLNYSNIEIYNIFKSMDDEGLAVAAHSIGDRAVRQFVEVTKDLKNKFHKLEHCQVADKNDLTELRNPGIQPYFYLSDRLWVNKDISKNSIFYPLKSLIDTKPLGGSDFPVESFDPFNSIKVAVQRMDGEGIDLKYAIDMYTINPDEYLGQKLNKWILVKNFYSESPEVVKEVKI
jgi:predicted amidohydrolase YtcJ